MIYNICVIILAATAIWCAWRICVADFRRRIIPDAYLWPLLLIGMIFAAWMPMWPTGARTAAIGAATGYALSAAIGFLFDRRMRRRNADAPVPIGLGDIKLIATGGVWLGPTGMAAALVVACVTGMIWGITNKQKYIPFAPFFICGGILSLIGMLFLL